MQILHLPFACSWLQMGMKGHELTVEWARQNGLSTPIRLHLSCFWWLSARTVHYCMSAFTLTHLYFSPLVLLYIYIPTTYKVCCLGESLAGITNAPWSNPTRSGNSRGCQSQSSRDGCRQPAVELHVHTSRMGRQLGSKAKNKGNACSSCFGHWFRSTFVSFCLFF